MRLTGQVSYDFRSESVVAEEDVAYPRDKNGRLLVVVLRATHIRRISTYLLASGMERMPTKTPTANATAANTTATIPMFFI